MAMSVLRKGMDRRKVSSLHELFVDNYIIDAMENLIRTLHQPIKYDKNPVIIPDKPWEKWPYGKGVLMHGTVLYDEDEKIFKMWYFIWIGQCYAISKDGLHWEKPSLGLFEYDGSKDNNIVHLCVDEKGALEGHARTDGLSIIKDKNELNPAKRYKGLDSQQTHGVWPLGPYPEAGLYVSFSPDGIRWKTHPKPVLTHKEHGVGDRTSLTYDYKRKKYVAFTKASNSLDPWDSLGWKRIRTISESDDFINWTKPVSILQADDQDPPNLQLYSMEGWNYEGMYLATLGTFHNYRSHDIQLSFSRDEINWFRGGNRQTFIPCGVDGEWDAYNIACASNAPLEVGDGLWFYYSGRNGPHAFFDKPLSDSAIGLAKLRKDGFISLDAGDKEGILLTKPFVFEGDKLFINADAKNGQAKVEILDYNDEVISDFACRKCQPLDKVDSTRYNIRWIGNGNLKALEGKEISFRFFLRNTKLYSFWFEE